MKKIYISVIALLLCAALSVSAFAKKDTSSESSPPPEVETTQDMSAPRLMVTDYKLSRDSLKPGKTATLEITFKNFSSTKSIRNIKLSLSCDDGDIKTVGMPSAYVSIIYAGAEYKWKIELSAEKTAAIGEHKLTVSGEYEDKYYSPYASSDVISVNVKQSVGLDWSGLELPAKAIQGSTETLSVSLMNTGKTDIRNCKISFDIDGLLGGGTVFVGEIPAGENKIASCNLRVSSEKLGTVSGEATISYEDVFGKKYTKKQKLETLIEEKVNIEDLSPKEDEVKKNSLWWVFLLTGLLVGGGIGCAVPIAVYSGKQRKEDEMRL